MARTLRVPGVVLRRRRTAMSMERREAIAGVLFALPALLGFLIFWLGPIVASFLLSLTDWNIVGVPHWVGLSNYVGKVTATNPNQGLIHDPLFWKSVRVSVLYAAIAVPGSMLAAFLIALMLAQPLRLVGIFRTIYYLPAIVPAVATALMWLWLYNPDYGLFDTVLYNAGLPTSPFLTSEKTVVPSIALLNVWACGGMMVVFLAALKGVPRMLYEAAALDGAGPLRAVWHITLPTISPIILFNFLTAVIGIVASGIVQGQFMTGGGGPNNASLFYGLYIYRTAFQDGRMGYAMAMGVIMFLFLLVFTLVAMRVSRSRVYYEE
ncbi:MAG: sugar ABC transporter permease [Chloroflexi bacterium]|nr:sugar ABC transporter permease [Chloroflexota bacterium]